MKVKSMKMFKKIMMLVTMVAFAQLTYANVGMSDAKAQKCAAKMQEMQTSLGITDAQMSAWNDYKASVMKRKDTLSQEKMKIRAAREGVDVSKLTPKQPKVKGEAKKAKVYANTASARFDQQINFEKLNVQTLEAQKTAFEKLYKTLTPAQQKIADQTLKVK
jgi:hypothetical protein